MRLTSTTVVTLQATLYLSSERGAMVIGMNRKDNFHGVDLSLTRFHFNFRRLKVNCTHGEAVKCNGYCKKLSIHLITWVSFFDPKTFDNFLSIFGVGYPTYKCMKCYPVNF